jgi:hypothetical protein
MNKQFEMLWLEFINLYISTHNFEDIYRHFRVQFLQPSSRQNSNTCIKRLYGYRRGWVETEVVRVP